MIDQKLYSLFDEIYNSTYERCLSFIIRRCENPSDISDIMQDTYTEVYTVMQKKGAGYIENPDAFVLRVAKTKVCRYYSLVYRLRTLLPLHATDGEGEDAELDIEDREVSLEEDYLRRELIEKIEKMIRTLPSETQKIFYLYYYDSESIANIAALLGRGESYVKNRLYRTLKAVRELYGKELI